MSYPFEYKSNYIKDKDKYNINELKKILTLNYDMIQVPRHGRVEMIREQRGTCWLADDNLTFEYSGKSKLRYRVFSFFQIFPYIRSYFWKF